MIAWRLGSRFAYFVALVLAFCAGFYLHSTPLPTQSQNFIYGLKHSYIDHDSVSPSEASFKEAIAEIDTTQLTNESPHVNAFEPVPDSSSNLHDEASPGLSSPAHDVEPADGSDASNVDTTGEAAEAENGVGFTAQKEFFQIEMDNKMPNFDVAKFRTYSPRNYKGPGHEAFATFFLSRNDSMHDPYFLATMQVVYRLLWDRWARSEKHPVIVFVGSFVPDTQRAYFEASGAIVREVESHPFVPNQDTKGPVAERLQDMFCKLEMWNQTEFSRIVYLDSDAFPLINIDLLLSTETVPDQQCNEALLSNEDRMLPDSLCSYAFGAVHESSGMMNAGVMMLKPDEAMYTLLMREYHNGNNFDNGFLEQALLSYVFRQDGPFPPTNVPEAWNGAPQVRDNGAPLYVLHAKIWALFFKVDHWASSLWEDTWNDLVALYEDPAFEKIRERDYHRTHLAEEKPDISKWHLDDS